jgi:hypothetical protein
MFLQAILKRFTGGTLAQFRTLRAKQPLGNRHSLYLERVSINGESLLRCHFPLGTLWLFHPGINGIATLVRGQPLNSSKESLKISSLNRWLSPSSRPDFPTDAVPVETSAGISGIQQQYPIIMKYYLNRGQPLNSGR